jgi:endonuclease/exonuclease/phosphatase family metal-dependent hydrolase
MATLRKFTKRFFIISNVAVVILFLLACANGWLHPDKWWVISILGLVFPLLLALVFGFFIFWLLTARRWALVSFIAMIIGWPNIHIFLALNFASGFRLQKPPDALRVLTWNVRRWDEFTGPRKGNSEHRTGMMDFLRRQNADILCFQEFFQSHNPKEYAENIAYIQKQMNLPYYFFSQDYHRYDWMYETGVIIFSRYPITNTIRIKYGGPDSTSAAESLIAADINVNGQTIRIFTTHLQSVLFRNKDFRNIEIIRNVDDSVLQASKSIVKKLKRAYSFRSAQADLVSTQLGQSPYPAIICGDFNDVPNSYTYSHIRGKKQDAFIKKGFGIGRTYVNLSPTLRIDFILADPEFEVLQCMRSSNPYSDHHPVIADLKLPTAVKQ